LGAADALGNAKSATALRLKATRRLGAKKARAKAGNVEPGFEFQQDPSSRLMINVEIVAPEARTRFHRR
jgi:hypothetical protein